MSIFKKEGTGMAPLSTNETVSRHDQEPASYAPKKLPRLLSLDVFRGMTIAFMILVNNPGNWAAIYAPLEHSDWNGCTPTDLVFPFFLFISGVSIVFSLENAKRDPHKKLIIKILRRGVTIFLIGVFLNLYPFFDFGTVRIMGVLQRIALVYMACSLLFLYMSKRKLMITAGLLLAGYYLLMVAGPLLLTGAYTLEPGKSMAAYLDRAILTNTHMWKMAGTWDPEGLISTIPAIASGIIGIMAGLILSDKGLNAEKKVISLFINAFILVAAGLVAGLAFPINKSLWTSSFVLYTGGIAMAFLAFLYTLIDVNNKKKGLTFFKIFGMNSIAVFFLSGIVPRTMALFPVAHENGRPVTLPMALYAGLHQGLAVKNASLAFALVNVAFYFSILAFMYRKKLFIKI